MRVRHVQWLIAAALSRSARTAHRPNPAPIVVAAGGNLQAALDQAQPGQIVQLQAGATFTGNFVLPQKDGQLATSRFAPRRRTRSCRAPPMRIDLAHEPLLRDPPLRQRHARRCGPRPARTTGGSSG